MPQPFPRNVFVLSTGRCGSTTFAAACAHVTNFTSGHETRVALTGPARLAYAPGHIEVDNRLSWFLGRLEQTWGDRAAYVHLTRDPAAVAASFVARGTTGILHAYRRGILMRRPKVEGPQKLRLVAEDYIETVTANITAFLAGKTHVFAMAMEDGAARFPAFWDWIGATGDKDAATAEWSVRHNAGSPPPAA